MTCPSPASAVSGVVAEVVAPKVGTTVAGVSASAVLLGTAVVVSVLTVPALGVVVASGALADGIVAGAENAVVAAAEAIVVLKDVFDVPVLVRELFGMAALGTSVVGLLAVMTAVERVVVGLLDVMSAVGIGVVGLLAVLGSVAVDLKTEIAAVGGVAVGDAVVAELSEMTLASAIEVPHA